MRSDFVGVRQSKKLGNQGCNREVFDSVGIQVELRHQFLELILEVLCVSVKESLFDIRCYLAVVHKAVNRLTALHCRGDLIEEFAVATNDVDSSCLERVSNNTGLAFGNAFLCLNCSDFDFLFFVELQLEFFVVFSDRVELLHRFRLLGDTYSFTVVLLTRDIGFGQALFLDSFGFGLDSFGFCNRFLFEDGCFRTAFLLQAGCFRFLNGRFCKSGSSCFGGFRLS